LVCPVIFRYGSFCDSADEKIAQQEAVCGTFFIDTAAS
jgi:hypothetical protein